MTSLRELERRELAAKLHRDRPRYVADLKQWGIEAKDNWSDNKVFDVHWNASIEADRPKAEARAERLGVPTKIFGFRRNPLDITWDCMEEERRRQLEGVYGNAR